MRTTAVIISKCIGKSQRLPLRFRFHFKGMAHGHAIKGVQLEVKDLGIYPTKDKEFLIYASVTFKRGYLIGKALKIKELPEDWK